jgi:mannosyl-oligosaccharide glucosidase
LDRIQWWGTQVDKGDIWRAKGKKRFYFQQLCFLTCLPLDLISESIVLGARERLEKTTDQQDAFTNPYKYFTLKNTLDEAEGEVANLYTFQKVFKGEFQVGKHKKEGEGPLVLNKIQLV